MAGSFKRYDDWVKDIRSSYRPFLTVNAVNKYSRRHQYFCPVQSRIIHLLSDGELYAYKGLVHTPGIIEVYEQYALDPLRTMNISEKIGYVHPKNWKTGLPYIMSTDFVVRTLSKRTAYTFKYWEDLYFKDSNRAAPNPSKLRTWQKLAIENEYWKSLDTEYRIITERDFPKSQFYNLRKCEYTAGMHFDDNIINIFINTFYELWQGNPCQLLGDIINKCAKIINLSNERCVDCFNYSVLKRIVPVDHSEIIQMHLPLKLLAGTVNNE